LYCLILYNRRPRLGGRRLLKIVIESHTVRTFILPFSVPYSYNEIGTVYFQFDYMFPRGQLPALTTPLHMVLCIAQSIYEVTNEHDHNARGILVVPHTSSQPVAVSRIGSSSYHLIITGNTITEGNVAIDPRVRSSDHKW
jgi:hypothetical protein